MYWCPSPSLTWPWQTFTSESSEPSTPQCPPMQPWKMAARMPPTISPTLPARFCSDPNSDHASAGTELVFDQSRLAYLSLSPIGWAVLPCHRCRRLVVLHRRLLQWGAAPHSSQLICLRWVGHRSGGSPPGGRWPVHELLLACMSKAGPGFGRGSGSNMSW